ncbi:MAG: glycogen synthase GlgA, partial [Rubricella sp.]
TLPLYVLDAPHLYDRAGSPYLDASGTDWPDNDIRFAALSWAAVEIAERGIGGWRPEVLHLHDWQAALAPTYLRARGIGDVGTLLTIHNIAFQGVTGRDRMDVLRLPKDRFTQDGFEYWGRISALKAGLVDADRISTVSPTYAAELLTPEFGMGLDGVMRARAADVTGILNGIDLDAWAPPYKSARGKARHKAALRAEFGLGESEGPLCVVISRLTGQKGLDMLADALPALLDEGGQLALLGSGEKGLEARFTALSAHPAVSVRIGYDEALAHRMIAGGDAILVPSRFEPCGLTQLYGLRFGTLPLVALTGGLADTVIDANSAALRSGAATGVQFHPVTTEALALALKELCALYRDAETWARMQRNAMRQPVGWDASAAEYAALFEGLKKTG